MAADGTPLNISPMGNLRTNSGAVLIVAAIAGHGLACLPTYLVGDALHSRRLVTVLDDYMAPPLPLRALYPHNRYLSAKVRAFVDFLATRFGQEPPWDSWRRTPGEPSALSASHRREMPGSFTKPRRSKTGAGAS
jgi:DNA-binding transcriptional LysR family regulator